DTLPPSSTRSSSTTSATRRSRNVLLAVSTACFAASSHDVVLVPISSVTRYTLFDAALFAMARLPFAVHRRSPAAVTVHRRAQLCVTLRHVPWCGKRRSGCEKALSRDLSIPSGSSLVMRCRNDFPGRAATIGNLVLPSMNCHAYRATLVPPSGRINVVRRERLPSRVCDLLARLEQWS